MPVDGEGDQYEEQLLRFEEDNSDISYDPITPSSLNHKASKIYSDLLKENPINY